ncbi:hypothetical protein MA16_Dca003635 [Dendrobium catenatum]|uniref:Uncharacterized protein n=1 Tax=Dendrobium catenatum TaxID=906689 RepID=A0A2I0WFL9_9ASPA|nr:hypothetical protein MA16_Dca003635 [Dendrobium catenatum]
MEEVQLRAEAAAIVEKSVEALGKSSGTEEAAVVEVFKVQSTNHFAFLVEKNEEEGLGNRGEIDKALDKGLKLPDPDASHIGLGSLSGAAKIKLAKELR